MVTLLNQVLGAQAHSMSSSCNAKHTAPSCGLLLYVCITDSEKRENKERPHLIPAKAWVEDVYTTSAQIILAIVYTATPLFKGSWG